MAVQITGYPYRQALSRQLKAILIATAVPSINMNLTLQMGAAGVPSGKIPQFADVNVVIGDLMNIQEPTICIVGSGEDIGWLGAGGGGAQQDIFGTQIRIKTPWSANNFPEDFELLFSVCTDTIRDCLNQSANTKIKPVNPHNQKPLIAGGGTFRSCMMTGSRPMTFPTNSTPGADTITRTRGWLITHIAKIDSNVGRPNALGQ
ncbi:hypothetical protein CCAX7_14520 [Capsulimonas corticalis]|uniref:Uncharacterized protein n=1 Tax=Capsulimonas corticalis TaxID=2219043 RepID=A0A402CZG8_9BACT|nr:hypothetical protein [Capsulimonas corticalis]BDI29401.1 hypothetical protein CCAX7_14520 [Capsulimonas corticalis]